MNSFISSNLATDIIQRRAMGQTVTDIAAELGVDVSHVNQILSQIPSELIPSTKRKFPSHELSTQDRQKGGAKSQATRQKQRHDASLRIKQLLSVDQKPIELAVVTYFLRSGSPKDFSITIPSEEVGLVFQKAFQCIDIPSKSVRFQWRQRLATFAEKELIQSRWGALGSLIEFPNSGTSQFLRLHVSSFLASDNHGTYRVSSRALAQAFLSIGQEVLSNVSKG